MKAREIKAEMKILQVQLTELTKIFKASNLTDKDIQDQLTKALFRKKYLQSIS